MDVSCLDLSELKYLNKEKRLGCSVSLKVWAWGTCRRILWNADKRTKDAHVGSERELPFKWERRMRASQCFLGQRTEMLTSSQMLNP